MVGGVRRSAMISLSNVSDDRMRAVSLAHGTTQRTACLANNAVYDGKPDFHVFQNEMKSLYESFWRAWACSTVAVPEKDRWY